MNAIIRGLSPALIVTLVACGGGSSDDEPDTGTVSFGLSDAPVDDLKSVTVEIDRITLKRLGASDVVIDRFTSTALGVTDVDSFQIDLLDYQGSNQAIVVDQMVLPAGQYTDLRLDILDQNINRSFVVELNDTVKAIKVPSDELKLGGLAVERGGVQTFTIDFDLRQAMTYRVGPDDYILKPRGVHILDNATAAALTGEVDSSLFNTVSPCDSKTDPTLGNVLYLYQGHGLAVSDLADVYDPLASTTTVPGSAIAPYAADTPVQQPGGEWTYSFGFLPPGDYTLAFSCVAENDSPDDYDGLTLPLPTDQYVELTLDQGVSVACDLPISGGACGN